MVEGLDVDGANVLVTATSQLGDEVAANESSGPRHQNEIARVHLMHCLGVLARP
jgi:hypothetical protein